ncbi:MAG: hypothetical protein KAS35_00755 [Candidatus Marinimicrobia bacterium]|nr:hypothetical protein [Candidatus Neomarinimicrobiota bacterium]
MQRIIIFLFTFSILINAQDCKSEDKLTIQPYGFFKFDMSYDSDLMSAGNFARWAKPNSSEDAIPTTNITSKQSRFGMNINKGAILGKVEIDFYGSPSVENKGRLMLRKAYAEAKFTNFSLRAGQDSDVISPLVPSTINYPVAWWAGNIGYRRPMLKLFGTQKSVSWTLALARNIGGDLNGDGIDDGSEGVLPEVQGRLAFTLMRNYTVGFSGHFAQLDTLGEDGKYKSWSTNLDLNLKITPKITLSGEAFLGTNMAAYLGSIANASTFKGIDTQGGWVNLKIKPNAKHSLSTGFSMDDPCDYDLNDGARSKNTMVFANIYHDILDGFLVGFEISYWSTEYKNMDTATAMRGQLAFLYKF